MGIKLPFINITLKWNCSWWYNRLNTIAVGKEKSFKYKDCSKEMTMLNKEFIEIMLKVI